MNRIEPQDDLTERTRKIRAGETCAVDSVGKFLARIDSKNPALNAYHEVLSEDALARAEDIDRRIAQGENPGPLAGASVAIKDNICTKAGHTTCSSRMLENYRSPFDATVIERIETAGGIVIGKTNLDEFAMGSSSEHCAWGPVRNPVDPDRVPGGSSGGSAAAVSADLADAALGSDTGGSIRQPAAFCGCVGFKPTYGRISRWGLVAFGSSLDQVGPITRSVRDAALLYSVLAGPDPRDSTCAEIGVEDPEEAMQRSVSGLRVGVAREHLHGNNHPEITTRIEETIECLRSQGARIVPIDLPLTSLGLSTYYVIAPAEASSNLARYDGVRYGFRAKSKPGESLESMYARTRSEGFGDEVKRRIMLGTYVLSAGYYDAYYARALRVRRLIKEEYDRAFQLCDVLAGPTSPTPAFRIGEKQDPLSMYLNDVYTVNANIAGICAISVPLQPIEDDGSMLPVGIHLQSQAFQESTLFHAAHAVECLVSPGTRHSP